MVQFKGTGLLGETNKIIVFLILNKHVTFSKVQKVFIFWGSK